MAFTKVSKIIDAELDGFSSFVTFRKTPSQTTTSGIWFDLNPSPGSPTPQYYAATPLKATALSFTNDGGLRTGGLVAPKTKILRDLLMISTSASVIRYILMDYLMFYPFIDEGTNDEQVFDNTVTLPRYTDGKGVMIMPVVVAAGSLAANVSFVCSYTNSEGVSGRTTVSQDLTTAQSVTGTVAHSSSTQGGPFLPLQQGDIGVRSIESITFTNVTDVGLITLVLVKPLANTSIRVVDAPVEIDYLSHFSVNPIIKDDACLSFVCCPTGNISGAPFFGSIQTVWS